MTTMTSNSMQLNHTSGYSLYRRLNLFLILTMTLVLGACASGVKLDDIDGPSKKASTGSAPATSQPNPFANQPWNDPKNPLFNKSFYFEFDSYVVKAGDQATLSTHAKFLNANKNQKVIIQGNTDDSGTTEYNLALGQKRSDAVRRALNLLGVAENQMEAVSLGKEKPKVPNSDDAARAENRRADLIYQ